MNFFSHFDPYYHLQKYFIFPPESSCVWISFYKLFCFKHKFYLNLKMYITTIIVFC